MIRFGLSAAGLVVCLGLGAALTLAEPPSDNSPPWADSLLEPVKLTPAKAQLDPQRWTEGGPYRLNTFQRLWDDWRQIDPTARATAKDFLAAADSFEGLIATAAPFIDVKPLPPAPAPKSEEGKEPPADEALSRAVIELHAALDKPLTPEQKKDLTTRIKAVPPAVARAAAVLLEAMPGALKKRNPHKAFQVKRQYFPGPGTMRFFDLGPGGQRRWWGNRSTTRLGYPRQARLRASAATGRAAPNTHADSGGPTP